MEFEKVVPFKNWSSTEFRGRYAGEDYTFAEGGVYSVPSGMAMHFAKQLAVEQLHALGTVKGEMLSDPDMKEYMDKCFPAKNQQPSMASSFERIDVPVADTAAKAAPEVTANKTVEIEQQETTEDDEADASDDKNNAGAPVFKAKLGRPAKTRDAEYTK